jgi:hypothetical protein
LQQILLDCAVQAGCLVDAGHEDACLSRDGVPEAVDPDQDEQGHDVDAAGEQAAESAGTDLRGRELGLAGVSGLVLPDLRFGQALADPPDDGGDDEQMQEDQP